MKKKSKSSDAAREDRERNDALNKSKHKDEEKLPGEYPREEDIMNRRDSTRVGLDVENYSRTARQEVAADRNEPTITDPVGLTSNRRPDENEIPDHFVNGDVEIVDEAEQPQAKEMERPVPKNMDLDNDNIELATGNESDVTAEDLEALGPKDLSMDMGEDEEVLKHRVYPVDMAGKDLDIPTGENVDEDLDEAIGPQDEENDFYSLGGDRLEDNMEGK